MNSITIILGVAFLGTAGLFYEFGFRNAKAAAASELARIEAAAKREVEALKARFGVK